MPPLDNFHGGWLKKLTQEFNCKLAIRACTGSILGVQANGLKAFKPNGSSFRFPGWAVRTILFPIIVKKLKHRGVREGQD